ncbi:hypothetical protein GUJ93_ZPchr0013g37779 [Zizania palustris]|uniref:Uncharacterized protein n=1 Tax=Zizania palustris TaxID=103762 RepID=A0A8J5X1G1_ZIZPA|nr:hypothetical protein GUJ93_ZPchr0013g37779 [Zizania palustris]
MCLQGGLICKSRTNNTLSAGYHFANNHLSRVPSLQASVVVGVVASPPPVRLRRSAARRRSRPPSLSPPPSIAAGFSIRPIDTSPPSTRVGGGGLFPGFHPEGLLPLFGGNSARPYLCTRWFSVRAYL